MKTRFRLCIAVLYGLVATVAGPAAAQVQVVTVTGEFRPSALNPGNTAFRNTTPPSRYCNWRPEECSREGAYIFDVGGGGELWRKSGDDDDASRRDTTYVRFPLPRMITLQDASTGQSFEAKVSFVAISMRLNFANGADPWLYGITGGCTTIFGAGGLGWGEGAWRVRDPLAPQECYSTRVRNGRTYVYRSVGIGLNVELPSALELQGGRYTGQEEWTTGGAGADIDLGDNISGTQAISMNFVFDVIHDFQVRFPAEQPQVQLAPEGGWKQWVDHGIAPASLRQVVPFQLTTSMDFSMKLRCEYPVDSRCGIRNTAVDAVVPVDVDVTLPGMTNLRDGRPAQFTALSSDDGLAPRFTPDGYLMRRRSTLNFSAGREAVTEMLKAPGSRWEGNMTVVFDANP